MSGRHQRPTLRTGLRWMAGALSVGLLSAAGAAIMATANPAGAAPPPNPSYHPGLDTATFAVTGVLDGNCAVSTGGTEVWIKPGDKIDFNSSLAGINLPVVTSTITGLTSSVSGLNVTATIDAGTPKAQTISVVAGKTTAFPSAAQLSGGDHKLTWTATSVDVLPVLGAAINVPLSNSALQSGAALSWQGVIHVTSDTAQCKLSVGTPQVAVSVGPIKVTVPPINVSVPLPNLPSLPSLPTIKLPGLPGGGPAKTPVAVHPKTNTGGGVRYTPPPRTVPEQVVGHIGTQGGGGSEGLQPDANRSSPLGIHLPQVPVAGNPPADPRSPAAAAKSRVITKRVDLAANRAPVAQLPVLLAIVAIIALSLVTATYARLYLLRRNI